MKISVISGPHKFKKMNISKLLKSPEGKTLEFKRDTSALKQIMRTIVAFANTAGGTIVVGLEDNGDVVGVNDPLLTEEQLASSIADSIAPLIRPEIEIVSTGGKSILCIQVSHWPGPFYIKSEAEDRGVYIRLGSSTRQASPEFIAEMKRLGEGISFDRLPRPELTADDLNIKAIQEAFQTVNQEITDEKLVSLGLLVPYIGNLVPSNGGIILFGSDSAREQFFPDARVSCALFEGTDKANFLDWVDIDGGVFPALTEVPKFVRRNSRLAANIESFKRKDVPAYSTVALREVLTNAIAHTDYSLTGMRIMVAIFSDRLEVQSPGILPFGMTLDNFKAGTSVIRNHTIAKVLRHLSLMEEWGSGYRRIETFCTENGYDIPEWFEIGPSIRVVLPPHPLTIQKTEGPIHNDVPVNVLVNVPVNKRQQWFIEQLKQGCQSKPADIVEKWGVVEKTAKRDISDLQKKGLVKFMGAPKTGTYLLIEKSKAFNS